MHGKCQEIQFVKMSRKLTRDIEIKYVRIIIKCSTQK